jgi:hypothetical protein
MEVFLCVSGTGQEKVRTLSAYGPFGPTTVEYRKDGTRSRRWPVKFGAAVAVTLGAVGLPTDPLFRPTVVGTYVRIADVEYKLLEDIAARLGPARIVRGAVTIFIELSTCSYCAGVIEQFRLRYPNPVSRTTEA